MTDIHNGINAGKTVTVHDTQINFNGWKGTGYTILDPNTGAGAYMIGGGLDGGWTDLPAYSYMFGLAAILFVGALFASGLLGIPLLIGSILAFGCGLSNYYDSTLPADLSVWAAGLILGLYGFAGPVAFGILMFIFGSSVGLAATIGQFSGRCRDA